MRWTPSKLIHRLGFEINHPDSICYWAAKVRPEGCWRVPWRSLDPPDTPTLLFFLFRGWIE